MTTVIRDPLWNNVRIDDLTMRFVDTRAFQRLRYVRQLGLAFLVYPGATHSRFEHALGAYHLARTTLALLAEHSALAGEQGGSEPAIVRAAALLHDVGHYPFSHALEEIGALHHEEVARPLLFDGELGDALRRHLGDDAPERVYALIRGRSESPFQGLISGSLDLDKIEYLKRDALMCGVPYGEVDVDRLTHSLRVLEDPSTGRPAIGVTDKGLAALESLLFAKYQMYRNVYWHHAVRSATAMYKRLVDDALAARALSASALASYTDEGLLTDLERRAPSPLLAALRERRLYKRAIECPAESLADEAGEWIATDRPLALAVEDALARELDQRPGTILVDYPAKAQMLGLDILVRRRGGGVERLTESGSGEINLPQLSDQLYRSARWLRVFVERGVRIPTAAVLDVVQRPADALRATLARGAPLLAAADAGR
jgi:HD superfamily phosphohydrolase